MAVRIQGAILDGLETVEVTVEAYRAPNLRPQEVRVVGLPDAAVREGVQRARSAVWPLVGLVAQGLGDGILLNLAPADRRKTGRCLDLALAMAYAAVVLGVNDPTEEGLVFFGELLLSGEVRPVPGSLGVALSAGKRRRGLVLPEGNLAEAALASAPALFPVRHVKEALDVLRGRGLPYGGPRGVLATDHDLDGPDLSEVSGQFQARRALEIAAAGGHNLLMEGPPGSGKTMLARRLVSVLPPLDDDALLETARILSISGRSRSVGARVPPFRSPHHTATPAGLAGGGNPLRPGEFTLAHRGVLFLDEFPEFERRALEVLREPLEEGVVHLTRAGTVRSFPSRFLCVAAMNPCPCGYHGLSDGRCRCTPRQIDAYRGRLSGPLLDRFDMRVFLHPVKPEALFSAGGGEPSALVRERVVAARRTQATRFGPRVFNGTATEAQLREAAHYGPKERALLIEMVTRHHLSARATRRLERVARTLADLGGDERVSESHLLEAVAFRQRSS